MRYFSSLHRSRIGTFDTVAQWLTLWKLESERLTKPLDWSPPAGGSLIISWNILEQDIRINLLRSTQNKSSTNFGLGYGGKVASVGCEVKLCDLV